MSDTNKRLESLDALRGFDMLFIMGFASLIIYLCQAFPCGFTEALELQMKHVSWDGLRHHDTIFPLFLFIAGTSFPFSMKKRLANGHTKTQLLKKAIERGIILFLLGLVYGGFFQFKFSTMRIPSVLGRIGIAWMIAAILQIYCSRKTRAIIASATLIIYSAVLCTVVAPDAPAGALPLSMEGNIAGWIDRTLLNGHIYVKGIYDPEGILSTLPAAVTAMLGMFTGEFLLSDKFEPSKKALYMFLASVAFAIVGYAWSFIMPFNKMLWSSSFVCILAAYSLLLLSLFYWLIDVKGWKKWAFPFKVIGMNSITIYMAQRIFDFYGVSNFFLGGLASLCNEPIAAAIKAAGYILVSWLFLYFLYKKKIFLKV